MDQAAGKKAIPLFIMGNSRGIENEIIEDFIVTKCCKRSQHCYNNYDQGYSHLFLLMVKNRKQGTITRVNPDLYLCY